MTDDEARQITTEVLQEHKEARARLGCLRSKARRMAIPFGEIADMLDGRPRSDVKDLIARVPPLADAESILGEIEATEREIAVLENEINAQGFGEYIPSRSGKTIQPAPDDD